MNEMKGFWRRASRPAARRASMALALAILLVVSVIALPVTSRAGEVEERATRSVAAPAGARVLVTNRSGDTTVRAWDRSEVEVEIVKRVRMRDEDRARDMLKKLSVDVEVSGQEIRVKARYPEREMTGGVFGVLFSDRLSAKIDLILHVPAVSPVNISTTSGDVEVRDVGGPVRVDCTSGDVVVSGVKSDVEVDCTSGDVEVGAAGHNVHIRATSGDVKLSDVAGAVDVDATSGDITARGIDQGGTLGTISGDVEVARSAGDLRVTTSSGDTSILGHRGRLAARSSSGDLDITLEPPLTGPCRFDSSSGSVRVALPPNPSCRLELSTSAGSLHARLPLQVETVNRNHLVATAGRGGDVIEVSTASGDVQVSAGESE